MSHSLMLRRRVLSLHQCELTRTLLCETIQQEVRNIWWLRWMWHLLEIYGVCHLHSPLSGGSFLGQWLLLFLQKLATMFSAQVTGVLLASLVSQKDGSLSSSKRLHHWFLTHNWELFLLTIIIVIRVIIGGEARLVDLFCYPVAHVLSILLRWTQTVSLLSVIV